MLEKVENDSQHLVKQGSQLAYNLESLLKKHNLTASRLANILGIPLMTIRRLLSGETTDPRISTLKLIADYFNVCVDSLLQASYFNTHDSLNKLKPILIPVLDWHSAEQLKNYQNADFSQWKEWQSISLNEKDAIGKNVFALKSRPSMYPRFPQSTVFVIDQDVMPSDGDIVLVRMKSNNELTMRELVIDPPEWKLQSIVAGSNTLLYSHEDHKIIGVNILTLLYNRK